MSTDTTQQDAAGRSGVAPVRFSAPEGTADTTQGDALHSTEARDAMRRSPFGKDGNAAQGE
ncbi:hypothetical protein SAMN05216266_101129 [Amycolatopsis marina]|uniref:Uncharacterized protein n=1 Tax=Amycolatopsis marina TaxID=490629 RepID=A0A1I0VBS4_9PSEU|nr:hypothetical protein [Amycolatopsis marina]SFA73497.1 hypothetical protein SAMN05216266_101129 [Amycolatopsis marina]